MTDVVCSRFKDACKEKKGNYSASFVSTEEVLKKEFGNDAGGILRLVGLLIEGLLVAGVFGVINGHLFKGGVFQIGHQLGSI